MTGVIRENMSACCADVCQVLPILARPAVCLEATRSSGMWLFVWSLLSKSVLVDVVCSTQLTQKLGQNFCISVWIWLVGKCVFIG